MKGTSAASFVLGNDVTDYSTTTASASALVGTFKAEPRGKSSAGPAIVLGDDAAEYVSSRMAEEGLESRRLGQRYKPRSMQAAE